MKNFKPEVGIILGSGLSGIEKEMCVIEKIPYRKLKGMQAPGVKGHAGEMILGNLAGKDVALFSGRSHFYEGVPMEELGAGVRKIHSLGAKVIILTMAVGSLRKDFHPGEWMAVKDHINFMGANPLRGVSGSGGEVQFLEMSGCYSKRLQQIAASVAKGKKIPLRPGVYVAVSGPTYETPSEVKCYKKLGGDVVGMSLAPEAVVARACGLETLALCAITNWAGGLSHESPSHEAVLNVGAKMQSSLIVLLKGILQKI